MAKLSKDDLQQIIAEQMPKYKLAEGPAAPSGVDGTATRAKPEGHTPGLDTLRKKYLRGKFLSDATAPNADDREPNGHPPAAPAAADAGDDDTEIVIVEPKVAPHPLDRGSRPKAVVVSTTQKKIVGEQG
jgi:hypothetical protein